MRLLRRLIPLAALLLPLAWAGSGCSSLKDPDNLATRPWNEPDASWNYGNGWFGREFNQGR